MLLNIIGTLHNSGALLQRSWTLLFEVIYNKNADIVLR
jgi:hypothetical protein